MVYLFSFWNSLWCFCLCKSLHLGVGKIRNWRTAKPRRCSSRVAATSPNMLPCGIDFKCWPMSDESDGTDLLKSPEFWTIAATAVFLQHLCGFKKFWKNSPPLNADMNTTVDQESCRISTPCMVRNSRIIIDRVQTNKKDLLSALIELMDKNTSCLCKSHTNCCVLIISTGAGCCPATGAPAFLDHCDTNQTRCPAHGITSPQTEALASATTWRTLSYGKVVGLLPKWNYLHLSCSM